MPFKLNSNPNVIVQSVPWDTWLVIRLAEVSNQTANILQVCEFVIPNRAKQFFTLFLPLRIL